VPQPAPRVPTPIEPTPALPRPGKATGGGDRIFRNRSSAWRSAATAGLVGALLSILPFGFLLAFPLAGFLSVLFYRRRTWGLELSPSGGLRLGLLTGMLGFAMFVVLAALDTVVSHAGNEIRQTIIEAVHRQQARSPDPQARQILDFFLTPNGLTVMIIVGLIFMCIGFVLLAGLGGAASASLLRRKGPEN
jgi:MFS family permease